MIRYERLQTPREHLELLIEPPPDQFSSLIEQGDRARIGARMLGTSVADWRNRLQRELGLAGRVILTGHQPEFFHAGVFAKVIATRQLADRLGAAPIFLTVDSDIPKCKQLALPQIARDGLRTVVVPVPPCDPRRAEEWQPRIPRSRWLEFFTQVAENYEHYEASLLRPFADAWLGPPTDDTGGEPLIQPCNAMARGRAAVEAELGLTGIRELRVSDLCATATFRAFLAQIILDPDVFANLYNDAQRDYRRRRKVHNEQRPVPPLVVRRRRAEVPFWIERSDGHRRRLHIERDDRSIRLFADDEFVDEMPDRFFSHPNAYAERWPLEQQGWFIRPRALTLSMFVRLFVADLFIHGIGGAKYDEITSAFGRDFFQTELPPIACVTATVHLPLPRHGVSEEDVREAARRARDVRFNPQRQVASIPDELRRRRASLVEENNRLAREAWRDHDARQSVYDQIRDVNEAMLACDPHLPARLDERTRELRERLAADRIALHREYFYPLHLRSTLEELVDRMDAQIRSAPLPV